MAKIQENDFVYVTLPSGNQKIIECKPNTSIQFGKFGTVRADSLIGLPYSQTYEIISPTEIKLVPQEFSEDQNKDAETENAELGGIMEQTLAGDKIMFEGNQTLSMAEIEELKNKGVSGQELIDLLTKSHQDYTKKTEFSKAKYLKRKQAKYMKRFTPLPVSSERLLDLYTEKDIGRVLGLDVASLAHMLALANVRQGGNYLIVDETPSVLTTAILERIGDSGSVTVLHENEHPNTDGLSYFPKWMPTDDFEGTDDEVRVRLANILDVLCPEETPAFVTKDINELKGSLKTQYKRQMYRERQRKWVLNQCEKGFDAIIVCSTLELTDLMPRLIEFAAGSAPIVVFSEYPQHLVDLTLNFMSDLRVLAPTILETRVRKFQTLPGRIHPMMMSRGYSGQVLYAHRVYPSKDVQAAGLTLQRKKRKLNNSEAVSTEQQQQQQQEQEQVEQKQE